MTKRRDDPQSAATPADDDVDALTDAVLTASRLLAATADLDWV
ncbi:hypothetical protein [Actinophytocola glycyrrhizae]|uniref:Uncharacterized protein n=1 Tax=Actinophytocola glycyrrhizae TaxID=2044873 RepID=A0ABV9S876_9PSEU